MLDRLTGMRVLAKVAELGSLSAAARALDMSPTMATKHIVACEQRLDAKLLHRTTRRIALTEIGRRYLDTVEPILDEIEHAEAAASADHLEIRGTLRVTAPVSFGIRKIGPLLADFARLYPKVTMDLGLTDRIVDLIEEGWDVAVRIGRIADSALVGRRLALCRTAVCAAPSYLAQRGTTPRKVTDLTEHNCLGYTLWRGVSADRWSFGSDGAVTVPVNVNLRCNNREALLAAAVAGQGMVYQPVFLVGADIRAGRLISLALDHPTIDLPVTVLHASERRPPAKVRAFVDFIVQRINPSPDEIEFSKT